MLGTPVTGTLTEAAEQDVYTFSSTAGQRLYYDALDGDSDPINARLLDPTGTVVHINGNSDNDVAPFALTASSLYRLVIDGTGNATGDYSFRLLDLAAQPSLPLDTDLIGSLDPGRSVLIYTFSGTPCQTLYFDGRGSDNRAYWGLFTPTDVNLDYPRIVNDFERTLTMAGTHVLVLYGLAALLVPRVMDRPDEARVVAAKSDIAAIMQALKLYRLDNQRYRTAEQGLGALVARPQTEPMPPNWKPGGYLEKLRNDPWGRPYQYLNPGLRGEIDVLSLGADGKHGGSGHDADVGSWDL